MLGDYLPHDFPNAFIRAGGSPNQFSKFATDTAIFVIQSLQAALRIPVYFALGNEDSPCRDYSLTPDSPFLKAIARSIDVLDKNPEAARTFRYAGFYELPHPILPDQEIMVLNSVLWSTLYSSGGTDGGDPGAAEFRWLGSKLESAKNLDKKVILVMHIPPGADAYDTSRRDNPQPVIEYWRDRYTREFITLMQRYGDVVRVALAGHTHMDDFRVLLASDKSKSVALRITPAITPIFGNNPAFSILRCDLRTGAVADLDTYYLDLSSGGKEASWDFEYRFSTAYGYSGFSPVNLAALAKSILATARIRKTYAHYYAVSAPSPITSFNWPFYCCAETEFKSSDYAGCVHRLQAASAPWPERRFPAAKLRE